RSWRSLAPHGLPVKVEGGAVETTSTSPKTEGCPPESSKSTCTLLPTAPHTDTEKLPSALVGTLAVRVQSDASATFALAAGADPVAASSTAVMIPSPGAAPA